MRKGIILILLLVFVPAVIAFSQTPGLSVGDQAPDFETKNFKGETFKLSDYYSKGPVLIIFYRGGWCMYCNRQLQSYQQSLDEFEKRGIRIVALSVDKVDNAAKTVEEKELGFEVVSNTNADILEQYGLTYKVPDDLAKMYEEKYSIDLEAASGQTHHVIAIPATYVVDQSGQIIFAYANEDYKVRKSPEEILEFLDNL